MGWNNIRIRKTADILMTVLLMFLMAYQVTGEALHEWIGISMTVIVIIHNILNRRWYTALFRGSYSGIRVLQSAVNVMLLAAIALTAICGMSMSGHAVPFMYGLTDMMFARPTHLAMSHWSFVLMGIHLGMHMPAILSGSQIKGKTKVIMSVVFGIIGAAGLWLFLCSNIFDYMFFRVPFAFLDYDKAAVLVFFENLMMLVFWVTAGWMLAELLRTEKKHGHRYQKYICR